MPEVVIRRMTEDFCRRLRVSHADLESHQLAEEQAQQVKTQWQQTQQ